MQGELCVCEERRFSGNFPSPQIVNALKVVPKLYIRPANLVTHKYIKALTYGYINRHPRGLKQLYFVLYI